MEKECFNENMIGFIRIDESDYINSKYVSQEKLINFLLKEPEKLDTISLNLLKMSSKFFDMIWDRASGGEFEYENGNKRHVLWSERKYKWNLLDGKKEDWISDVLSMDPSRFKLLIGDSNAARSYEISFLDIILDHDSNQKFMGYWDN